MGRQKRFRCPGLRLKDGVYWVDIDNKRYGRIYESTGCSADQHELAEAKYRQCLNDAMRRQILGISRPRLFAEAAKQHLAEERDVLKSIAIDEWAIAWAAPYIGSLELEKVHDGTLAPIRRAMSLKGRKQKSINLVLQVVRKILNKAARKWRDPETGRPWLSTEPPLIDIPRARDGRPPYPISWDEERLLLMPALAAHLQGPVTFYLNVGPREQELCELRWAWERRMPEIGAHLFLLPEAFTKAGRERVLVLNRAASAVVEAQRGVHEEFVFSRRGKKLGGVYNTGWQGARAKAAARYREVLGVDCPEGFRTLHVHDLRHTFGRRLRAAGVSDETRADLLGHARRANAITSHYSAAEVSELVEAVKKLDVQMGSAPTLTVLRAQAA